MERMQEALHQPGETVPEETDPTATTRKATGGEEETETDHGAGAAQPMQGPQRKVADAAREDSTPKRG